MVFTAKGLVIFSRNEYVLKHQPCEWTQTTHDR